METALRHPPQPRPRQRKRGRVLCPLPQPSGEGGARLMEVFAFDPHGGDGSDKKRLTLAMSVPEEGEECGIGMDLIAEYRLEWLPPTVPNCVFAEAPELTKATITGCGHGFNAVALVYHFLKNGMTCPFCRAGHKGARMYWHLLPQHLRPAMRERLESTRSGERQAQVAEDAAAAWGALASNSRDTWSTLLTTGRQVLMVYAYPSEAAVAPIMAKEVVLDTSRIRGRRGVHMCPYVHGMRDLTRTVRMAGLVSGNFELVVASRDRHGCVLSLLRSRRFRVGTRSPECVDAELAQMQLAWSDTGDLIGFELTLPESIIPLLLERSAAASDEGEPSVFYPME